MSPIVRDLDAYAPMERAILKSLKLNQPVRIEDLKRAVYGRNEANAPRYWLVTVNGAVRRLQEKLVDNREPVRILREKLPGERAIATILVKR